MYLILARFLSGQSIIQLVNTFVGILLIWLLPINEYALYVLTILFLSVASMITNMGISRAIMTFGSKKRDDGAYLGSLFSTGLSLSKRFYFVVVVGIFLLSLIIFSGKDWALASVSIALLLVAITSWLQSKITMQQALLNIQHDDKSLFTSGLVGSGTRFLATGLCLIWPEAIVALVGNLAGALATTAMLTRSAAKYADSLATSNNEIQSSIVGFIKPLSPMIIYFAFQSQISILILGFYGYTESIAQVGALGRLGQIIALLMMLNPFFIQPYFSRIEQRKRFVLRLGLVVALIALLSIGLLSISMLLPSAWLFILGDNYSGLVQELPIVIAGALFTLLGGTLYTIILSRGETASQYWGVIVGVTSQIAFISMNGVTTTMDALYLNLLPALGYAGVQMLILARTLFRWKDVK